jgi:hypothetical protein
MKNIKRLWVLGAADPEMNEIERLLRDRGEAVFHARSKHTGGPRVHPGDAYQGKACPGLIAAADDAGTVYIYKVECEVWVESDACTVGGFGFDPILVYHTVDHHRAGDPGFGAPPEEYMRGSSLGQVLLLLGISPTYQQRLIAAADHCLAAAYRGDCPGVLGDDLLRHRAAEKAAFQDRPVDAVLADIESTIRALVAAPKVHLGALACQSHADGYHLGDCEPEPCRHIYVHDMRRESGVWPELPEAATNIGRSYIAGPLTGIDGRRKIVASGSPDEIRAFFSWAQAQGYTDAYGDPQRGFAGAYIPN